MALNAATMKLIMDSEGFRSKAYPDPATGGEPWTIAFGHTSAAGSPKVKKGMEISRAEGEAILARDLKNFAVAVRMAVKVPLNANQLGALVSFTYNVGLGNFKNSTLLRLLNAGDYAGAADEFRRWNKAAGKTMPGLIARRAAEARLFRTPPTADEIKQQVPPPGKKPANKAGLIIVALLVIAAIAFFILKH